MSLAAAFFLHGVALAAPEPATEPAVQVLEGLELSSEIRLVDAGQAPRKVLRYAPRPGASVDVEMVSRQSMDMKMLGPDGTAMSLPGAGDLSPTMVIGMHQEVGQPLANGFLPVTVRYTTLDVTDVAPELKQAMLAENPLKPGTEFRMLVDPKTGKIDQIDVSSDMEALQYQAMQSMADSFSRQLSQFPDEPVGVGAKWTLEMDVSMAGLQLGSTQHMTVTKIQGDQVELSFEMVMEKSNDSLDLPGVPAGMDVDLTTFQATGTGTAIVDLSTMACRTSSVTDLNMEMRMGAEGEGMHMRMAMKQQVEVRGK